MDSQTVHSSSSSRSRSTSLLAHQAEPDQSLIPTISTIPGASPPIPPIPDPSLHHDQHPQMSFSGPPGQYVGLWPNAAFAYTQVSARSTDMATNPYLSHMQPTPPLSPVQMMDYERLQREHAVMRAQLRCVRSIVPHIVTQRGQKHAHKSCNPLLESPRRYRTPVDPQFSDTQQHHHECLPSCYNGPFQRQCQDF